ncbi:MAG: universal stress protein, partial [Anaerolineae bacterium]|nr:universal stress protein [Anaerolineae bacterium]
MPASESQNAVTRVLVPVSNPQTVAGLLKLASALVTPETGEVIALFILRGDLEQETKTLNKLEPLVEQLQAKGHPVRLLTHKASGIARGILDAARDNGSDLIILGVQRSSPEEVVLGTIGENVLTTASCPVMIYRAGRTEKPIRRVVIPTDGSSPAQTAAALGLKLAHSYQTDAEAVYVHPGYRSRWEGLA